MKTQIVFLIIACFLMLSQIITSSIAYQVLHADSHFGGDQSVCFLYNYKSDESSRMNSSCQGAQNLFLLSIVSAIVFFISSAVMAFMKKSRSSSTRIGVMVAQSVLLVLALVAASLFTIGLNTSAANSGMSTAEFISAYTNKMSIKSDLINVAMNAAWASVVIWVISALLEGLAFYLDRRESAALLTDLTETKA